MERKEYLVRGIWFDAALYNETIRKSPMYKERVSFADGYLSRQLFLTDEEVAELNLEERFGNLPFKLVTNLAIRLISSELKDKRGAKYDIVDARQVAMEIEDLEYGRIPKENMTPVHQEYIALWAEELEKLFGEIKGMKRQFPAEAYRKTEVRFDEATQQPVSQQKGRTMQNEMDELFRDMK